MRNLSVNPLIVISISKNDILKLEFDVLLENGVLQVNQNYYNFFKLHEDY